LTFYSQLKPVFDARNSLRQVFFDPAGPLNDRGITTTTAGEMQRGIARENKI
jgi:hypothetical protein